ncbi:hypothetical protein [Streptomyces sp. NBC_00239]|uniref:hypothetical protein n=1 Tax=Streptomyces sp. NBC_00239 TaxID=2903640 RepID=UPI002E29E038|nr:hypothetical protein [Streptomyces sp. NBC_00239]
MRLGKSGAMAGPFVVALGAGWWGARRGSLWRDEEVTWEVAQRSLGEIARLADSVDAVHTAYYALMHLLFLADPDPGELTLRLPCVLATAVTAALIGAIGTSPLPADSRRTRPPAPRTGLWAGLVYALTPFVTRYAQEGRSYALVACLVALATLLLARGRWAGYAFALGAACVLHLFAVLVVPAHLTALLLRGAGRAVLLRWAAGAAAAVTATVPLALLCRGQSAQIGWLTRPDARDAGALVQAFAGPAPAVLAVTLLLAAVALTRPRDPLTALAAPLALLPPALLLAVSQLHPLYFDRYVLYSLAGLPLLAAAGLDRLLPAELPFAALVGTALAALGLFAQLGVHERLRTPASRADDLAAVARSARHLIGRGDAVLYLPDHSRRVALAYPRRFAAAVDAGLDRTGAASGTLYGTETGRAELARRLAGQRRVWAVRTGPATRRGYTPVTAAERAKTALLREEYADTARYRVGAAVLQLYVRKPDRRPDRRPRPQPDRTPGREAGRTPDPDPDRRPVPKSARAPVSRG